MEFHPVANIFPMMSGEDSDALKADIEVNGQREPIWTHENKIIDGRNRYNACQTIGIEPAYREWDGKGLLVAFVVSLNLIRRHLNETQRGMVAARLTKMRQGERNDLEPCLNSGKVSQSDAAEMLNVPRDTVQKAARVIEEAQPDIIELCDAGLMTADAAASIAGAPVEFQQKVTEVIKTGEAKSAKDAIRIARREEVQQAATRPKYGVHSWVGDGKGRGRAEARLGRVQRQAGREYHTGAPPKRGAL